MEKNILAVAVSLALVGSVAAAEGNPVVITSDNSTYTQAKDADAHTAFQDQNIHGATGAETLTIEGSYTGGIYATIRDVTVDKLAGLSIHIKDIEEKEKNVAINGLHAKGEHTLTVNVGSLSLVAQGNSDPQSPVMIHAYGGNVNVDVSDNIDIAADEGNAVMVQHADAHDAKLVMRAGGDISISSEESSALLVGVLQKNNNKSTLEMEARNITIRGGYIGLQVYNSDRKWGGGYGDPCADIYADENVEIYGDLYGIYSESPSAKTTITANGKVTVEGGQSALVVENRSDQDTSEQSVTFMAPEVSLVLQGQNDATKAALDQAKGTNVVFKGVGGGATDVTIRAGNGKNAVSIGTNGTLAATNATLHVEQGNVAAPEGNMALTNSTVELGNDVTMDLKSLTGEGNNTIIFNSTKAGTVKIREIGEKVSNLTVLASGSTNDQFGSAAQLLSAMEGEEGTSNGIVQVGGTAKTTLGAEAGAVSGAWALNEDGQIVEEENAGLSAVREFSTATFAQWRLENNHLSQRLGDLRADLGKSGAWARVYGGESKITDGVDVKLQTTSVQVGADTTVAGNWIVGGAFTYTNLDADISNGTGDSDSYSLAAYATGLFDCGGYVDVIGRVGRISTDISASTLSASGGVLDGSYDNTTFGLSAEVGYHWKLTDTFYAEPQVELAYGYVLGDDFSASNGAKVSQDDFQSLVGRFGARVGANFAQDKGSLYLHASVNHDFLGDVDGTARAGARTESLDGDLGGTWVSYGIGAQFNTDADLNFYGMLERSHGNDYTDSYRYSVGMRYVF